jgi:peroxiredoxin Q/BCP
MSPDSVTSHRNFAEKKGISVDLLSDPKHEVLKAYAAWGKKKMYGKEFEGVIRSTVLIDPDGKIRQHWPKASTKGHAAEVLDALNQLNN